MFDNRALMDAVIGGDEPTAVEQVNAGVAEGVPAVETNIAMQWQIAEGSLNLPGITIILDGLSLDLGEVDIQSDGSGSFVNTRRANLDALIAFRAASAEEMLDTINGGIQPHLKNPVTSFKATRISLPGQRYRIQDFNMDLRDWTDIGWINGKLWLQVKPGHLIDCEVGLDIAKGLTLKTSLLLDAVDVPLLFTYDGETALIGQDEPFTAGATIKTLSPIVVYQSSVGKHLNGIPKELASIVDVPFKVSILPSSLSAQVQARLIRMEDSYWISVEKISPSGTLTTELDAGKLAKVKVSVKYGSSGSYGIEAVQKLPLGRSLTFKDTLKVEKNAFTAPFTSLQFLSIPIGPIFQTKQSG